jgi:Asp-tRNA(Asn)/Glu-tRNA(Gln) amidotransferase A subunit family amidase
MPDWPTLEAATQRIEARNDEVRALLLTRVPEAHAEHAALEAEPRSPLHGVPYSLKDAWDTAGITTTGGSWRHRDRVPETSSRIYEVFRAAGAVLVGKSNCSDLSLAPEASSWVGGVTRNPANLERTSGGSSGGAAAAVADGMVGFDWGSDIGGSIRQPAAFCGVYGMRLSSQTWPMHGEFPAPPEALLYMNGQGPITRTLDQMRAVLEVARPMRTGPATDFEAKGVYLYPPKRGRWPSFSDDVREALRSAVGEVRDNPPLMKPEKVRDLYSAIWASHFFELLGSDPTIRLGEGLRAVLSAVFLRGRFGDRRFHPCTAELLLLITIGRLTLYRKAAPILAKVAVYRASMESLWADGWLIAMPVSAYPAPKPGKSTRNPGLLTCVTPGNMTDATGLAIPFGTFDDGLPRAFQLMGPPGSEDVLLDVAQRVVDSRLRKEG